ncbi:hypothetical protein KTH71_06500 [Acinetobacter sp. WU_MDCI_Axc73]|nr:hypothetical protein [Acinetobacter sp. WU_MDCI_Axc73]
MDVKDKIEELEYEIINHCISCFYILIHHEQTMQNMKYELIFKSEKDKKKFDYLLNFQEKELVYQLIKEECVVECMKIFPETLGVKKFEALYPFLKISNKNEIPHLKVDRPRNEANYFQTIGILKKYIDNESCKKISHMYGYSLGYLIEMLIVLNHLKNSIPKYKTQIISSTVDSVFNDYINLNPWVYGIDNPALKVRINKARAAQKSANPLIDVKYKIMKNILNNEVEKHGKWENPHQAVIKNLDLIYEKFKDFDKKILEDKVVELKSEIKNCSSEVERDNFLSKVDSINRALKKNHPYDVEDINLPYNTLDFDRILIKRLRGEGLKLKRILVDEYFLK